jgi:hypothetical protein
MPPRGRGRGKAARSDAQALSSFIKEKTGANKPYNEMPSATKAALHAGSAVQKGATKAAKAVVDSPVGKGAKAAGMALGDGIMKGFQAVDRMTGNGPKKVPKGYRRGRGGALIKTKK